MAGLHMSFNRDKDNCTTANWRCIALDTYIYLKAIVLIDCNRLEATVAHLSSYAQIVVTRYNQQ